MDTHRLTNPQAQLTAEFIDYGATVTSLLVPDKYGALSDVLLGCPTPEEHLKLHPHFNCIVGRVANRITNAKFELDGKVYHVDANIPPHQLHSGNLGLANRHWQYDGTSSAITFSIVSEDGDAGFPGEVSVKATYSIRDSTLRLVLNAVTSHATPISLTSHMYFNLSGIQGNTIDHHVIQVNADSYLPVSEDLTQLGKIEAVTNTPFDLRTPKTFAECLYTEHPQLVLAGGFDHNFVINGTGIRQAAQVDHPPSGRRLVVRTNQPGMQLYTSNTLTALGKDGVKYGEHQGFCLETQQFPDAMNHSNYPNSILRPNEVFEAVTEFEFGVAK